MPYIGNDLATQFQAFATQTITGDGSTGYTLDRAVANGKELLVYINNVKQEEGSGKSYTASGTTITFSAAVTSDDSCYLVYLGSAVQTVTPPDGSVSSAKLDTNIAVSGTLGVTGAITASAGVKIGGTGDANTLDDYEEGTWTASLQDSSANSATLSRSGMTYTKVGRICHISGNIRVSSLGSASGGVRLKGLPFSINGASNATYSALAISDVSGLSASAGHGIMGLAYTGTDFIGIMINDASTGESSLEFSELSADGNFVIGGWYLVA